MRKILAKNLYRYNNREILKFAKLYEKNEKLSSSKLQDLQFEKLKSIISFTITHNRFYRKLWSDHGIDTEIKSLSDLDKFPLTDKTMLQQGLHDKTAISDIFRDGNNFIWSHTTGSSGMPFKFPLDFESIQRRAAVTNRVNRWAGFSIGDSNVSIWRNKIKSDSLKSKISNWIKGNHTLEIFNPIDPKSAILTEEKAKFFLSEINRLKPEIIQGYVSGVLFVAKYILENENAKLKFNPRTIITKAECLSEVAREYIKKAFRVTVYNQYGSEEFSNIAHECYEEAKSNHFLHIQSDRHYLEVLNDNKRIEKGEGEVVLTDLDNKVMPFIRFRTGDIAVVDSDKKSSSSLPFPLLLDVRGRLNDYLKLPNGGLLSSFLWQNLFKDYELIDEYQIVQEDIETVTVNYVVNDHKYDEDSFMRLNKKIENALPDCAVHWNQLASIPRGPGGKFRHNISKVRIELNEMR